MGDEQLSEQDSLSIERLLEFWFGTQNEDQLIAAEKAALWWKKNHEVDEQCRSLFQPLVESAGAGTLDGWSATARGRLALILLTDQMPRNIYRGNARSFAFDATARAFCLNGLAQQADQALRPIERVFFYMPLEHSESLELQQRSVALFSTLATATTDAQRKLFDGYLDFAQRHRDIIARFGRFPHRNALLGRASTPEEADFLGSPGSSF